MERVYGDYLIKCKVLPTPEPEANEEEKGEAADPDMPEGVAEAKPFYPYEQISVEHALVRTQITHVVVLFTAEYCPPCQGFM